MEQIAIKQSGYHIQRGRVAEVTTLTETEKLFRVVLPNGAPLDHDPGQFVEVSLFGVGEAPISICSSPTRRDSFELCIRAAGRVTAALHKLTTGAEIGIRGPFGVGFPVIPMEGEISC